MRVRRRREAQQRAEQKVLDDRELFQHLRHIHLLQALVDLAPRRHRRDVVQDGAVLVERPALELWDAPRNGCALGS